MIRRVAVLAILAGNALGLATLASSALAQPASPGLCARVPGFVGCATPLTVVSRATVLPVSAGDTNGTMVLGAIFTQMQSADITSALGFGPLSPAITAATYAPIQSPQFQGSGVNQNGTVVHPTTTITSSVLNQKVSDINYPNTGIQWRLLDDGYTTANVWLEVIRSGLSPQQINLNAATIALNGSVNVISNGLTRQVVYGAVDSGGTGFRTMRVAN